jgi:hypothetical protein
LKDVELARLRNRALGNVRGGTRGSAGGSIAHFRNAQYCTRILTIVCVTLVNTMSVVEHMILPILRHTPESSQRALKPQAIKNRCFANRLTGIRDVVTMP